MSKRVFSVLARLVGLTWWVVAFAMGDENAMEVEKVRKGPRHETRGMFVVLNRSSLAEGSSGETEGLVEACRSLVEGREERILEAGEAYQQEFGKPLAVGGYPSQEAAEKARWLRKWLSNRVAPGSTIVFLGDEEGLPTWEVGLGGMRLTTDSFYADLDGDGVPDTAVARVLGEPESMVRQLRGKKDYGSKAVILCSEDTRIHLETRAFTKSLSKLGYEAMIRGVRDDEALSASDFIVHFGHGSPGDISNRFGEAFVRAGNMPVLPCSPIVFVDGCGTLPVGSPLLRSFLKQGAVAYAGSTASVQGMVPARFTNELVEHFLRILAEQPAMPLPQILMTARAEYVRGHPGLAEKLRELADRGRINASGDESTHLLTVAEWVYYGDPRATMPGVGPPREVSREVASVGDSVRLGEEKEPWQVSFQNESNEGQVVLSLYADVPLSEREGFQLSVCQNGRSVSALDSHRDTLYQNIGRDCRGGYAARETYRARYLIPLTEGEGEQQLEVRLVKGSSAVLTTGTEVDVWPAGFEERIGLKLTPAAKEPVKVVGDTKLRQTDVEGFVSLELSPLFNRPHNSMQVGGGDNASFESWFSEDRVSADGVRFFVKRTGNDVLVSPNNTENVFMIKGFEASARVVHFLVWGYNNPAPAQLNMRFKDGSTQEFDLPLREWTQGIPPVAFDFRNTVSHFPHAVITHQAVKIAYPDKKIVSIASTSGTYGLVGITLEQ